MPLIRTGVASGLMVILAAMFPEGGNAPRLPQGLAEYRSWAPLMKERRAVPYDIGILCAWISVQDFERAAKPHGPHGQRFVQVYANPEAARRMNGEPGKPFPVGAILAKEKFLRRDSSEPEGTAFMIKHDDPDFRSSGGWEFLYFPEAGKTPAAQAACAHCHGASNRDYVLGNYERSSAGAGR